MISKELLEKKNGMIYTIQNERLPCHPVREACMINSMEDIYKRDRLMRTFILFDLLWHFFCSYDVSV